ncbi:uncharacterized protein LOC116013091 [Ipomoea triloba]|uniref:uncharacterized protein LOC116013091 n=1 Tax=Ipomoea triloba TaxID=35885 RepID=UPI00125D5C6F|nr:uncharacterized protein LOC116013091 [Ipomoea triloba]
MESLRVRRDARGLGEFEAAQRKYVGLLEVENRFWKQRAKHFLLWDGDRNTRECEEVLCAIQGRVSNQQNECSTTMVMVGEESDPGSLPEEVYKTHIVLIPKKQHPETMGDLRPIALCNVLYMVVVKFMANRLKDVIGRVVEFYSPKDKVIAGLPTQLVDFLIEDSKRNRIKCTLWDEHVPAVMPFFNNHVDGLLIILLQLCCAKVVDSEVRISSSYTATKVLFNLDCQEFADFRNSLKANCSPIRSISMVSYGHSANNSQSPMVVSTIRDLYERAEEGYYCVPGTIVSIESGKKWFYNSWRKPGCFKSLIFTETYYYCETCKTNWVEGNVRYRVVVRVLDKTSDAPFLLWEKDCFDLLGISAYDLKTKYSMAKMHVPTEFDQLRNKCMVFRINLKNEHIRNPTKPISVLSVMHDEKLEAQYCPSMVDDHDELSRMVEEEADDLESDESE